MPPREKIERRPGARQADRAGRGQAAATAQRHRTGSHVQAAGEGIGAGQRQGRSAALYQAAVATQDAAQRQRLAAQHVQRTTRGKVDVVGQVQRGACIQRGGIVDVQQAGTQCRVAAQQQVAAIDDHTAAECVGAIQREQCGAVLDQAAVAGNHTVEHQRLPALQRQRTSGAKRDIVAQRKRGCTIQSDFSTDAQCTCTQRVVVAQQQPATVEGHAAGKRVAAQQRLHAGTHLDQAARGAGEVASEGGVAEPAEGQCAGAQIHRAAEPCQRTHCLVGCNGEVQRRTGAQRQRTGGRQIAARTECQRAPGDRETTGQRIRATQGQRARTALDEVARTGQRSVQGQRIAAQQIQIATAVDDDVVGKVEGTAGIQRCGTAYRQVAAAQCAGIAEQQATGIEVDAAGEQIRTAQAHHTGIGHGEATGAGKHATQAEALGAARVSRH